MKLLKNITIAILMLIIVIAVIFGINKIVRAERNLELRKI